jgi:hypothetical protein
VHGVEHVQERRPGGEVVGDVVPELRELVEDHVLRVGGELLAAVVDLLDVALRARRPDDVGRIDDPVLQPGEALPAHALRQHGHAPAIHDPRDGDAAPAVVAGRRPDRAVARRVELPRDDARHQAPVRGEHLVGADHREPVAEGDDDARVHAGERLGEHHVGGHRCEAAARVVVEPVDPEQVQGVCVVGPHPGERRPDLRRDPGGVGELRERGEPDASLAKPRDRVVVDVRVHEVPFEFEWLHGGAPPHDLATGSGCWR